MQTGFVRVNPGIYFHYYIVMPGALTKVSYITPNTKKFNHIIGIGV